MKVNKYRYFKVIQQNYGQGWEDASEYETDSKGIDLEFETVLEVASSGFIIKRKKPLIKQDLKHYKEMGYPTRVIKRKYINKLQKA